MATLEREGPARGFGASGLYAAFRPGYPDALYKRVFAAVAPPFDMAVDLGAGTGLVANALAGRFAQVVAVEPDARMHPTPVQNEAGRAAGPGVLPVPAGGLNGETEPGNSGSAIPVTGVEWRHCAAEEAHFERGSVALATCANALYWMNTDAVLPRVRHWLRPGGVLAAWRYGFPSSPNAAVDALLQGELAAHWDAHRHERLRDEEYTLRAVRGSGLFETVEAERIPHFISMRPETLCGFVQSTSYVRGYMATLAEPDAYAQALGDALREAAGDEAVKVDFSLELVLAQ